MFLFCFVFCVFFLFLFYICIFTESFHFFFSIFVLSSSQPQCLIHSHSQFKLQIQLVLWHTTICSFLIRAKILANTLYYFRSKVTILFLFFFFIVSHDLLVKLIRNRISNGENSIPFDVYRCASSQSLFIHIRTIDHDSFK